jgi:hypothetical protein
MYRDESDSGKILEFLINERKLTIKEVSLGIGLSEYKLKKNN